MWATTMAVNGNGQPSGGAGDIVEVNGISSGPPAVSVLSTVLSAVAR
jgi:hypothetical protein